MLKAISILLLLNVVAFHCSIALMEMFSWILFAVTVGYMASKRMRFTFPVAIPLVALVAVVGVSLLLNPPLKPFWFQFGSMRWIFLLWSTFWALNLVWSESFEKQLRQVWMFCLALSSLYAMVQFVTGVDFFHHDAVVSLGGAFYKPTGFFSESLTFAYVTGAMAFAISGSALKNNTRPMAGLVLVLGAIGVVVSTSKGAWMGMVAAIFFYLCCERRRWLPYFVGGGGFITLVLAITSFTFRKRIKSLLGIELDHSSFVRLEVWTAYVEMLKDHPWFGVGIFQGDLLLPQYYERLIIGEEFVSHAHNVFLQWAAGAGIFAYFLYGWITYVFLKKAWRLRHVTTWGWPLLLAQVFLHIGALTEANFFDGETNHVYVFVWALTLMFERKNAAALASS